MAAIDLTALIDRLSPVIASAIATSGTLVDIHRRTTGSRVTGATDPDTLTVTRPTLQVVETARPAIVTPAARMAAGAPLPAVPTPRPGEYRVLLDAAVTTPRVGDVVTVGVSRDARLVGQTLEVVDVPDGFAGVVRELTCIPVRAPGAP